MEMEIEIENKNIIQKPPVQKPPVQKLKPNSTKSKFSKFKSKTPRKPFGYNVGKISLI